MENWQIVLIILGAFFLILIFLKMKLHKKSKRWIFKRTKETPDGKTTSYLIQGVKGEFKSQEDAEAFARLTKRW